MSQICLKLILVIIYSHPAPTYSLYTPCFIELRMAVALYTLAKGPRPIRLDQVGIYDEVRLLQGLLLVI